MRIWAVVLVGMAVVPVGCAPRVNLGTVPLSPADSVIARYYRAIGGYEQLKLVSSRRLRGNYTEGSMRAQTVMLWQRPALRRVEVHAPGFDYAEGFDGSTWEMNLAGNTLVRPFGAAADAGRRGAEFDESFTDYRDKGHAVTLAGGERVLGRDTYRLDVRLADGWEKSYFFDRATSLIVALRKAMPVHARGAPVTTLTSYEDWRSVDGLLVPHRFIERSAATGAVMNTLQWDTIEHNVRIEPSAIRAPISPTSTP